MLAIALEAAENAGRPYDAAVALGCVIRGDTFHFEIVAGESARALMDLSVARRIPLGNGIITVDTEAQAWRRARVGELNKGGGAAEAALTVLRARAASHGGGLTAMAKTAERSAARLAAVQALYQMDVAGKGVIDALAEFEAYWIGQRGRGRRLQAGRERLLPRRPVGRGRRAARHRRQGRQRRCPRAGR